ncbi:MAG: 50S ribosomal protein L25/general stress protein Ctc [Sporichthyaceae bacterium]
MSEVRISAESRTEFGKGAARRIRRDHKVPGVLYGHGESPNHITLPGHDLMLALKTANVLLNIALDGKHLLAIPKDVQRDPVRGSLEHVDLLLVRKGEKVSVQIPLHVVGHAGPDTVVVSELTVLEVLAEATHIPEFFEVDIEGLPAGTQIQAQDIKLPAGIELLLEPHTLVVNITGESAEAEGEPGDSGAETSAEPEAVTAE